MGLFDGLFDWIRSLFWKQEMEITLVGLQGAGKTTLLTAMTEGKRRLQQISQANAMRVGAGSEQEGSASGGPSVPDTIPTLGLNTRKVTYGSVTIKLWDIGGQPRFRTMWERYCRGVNSIVFVVDSQDHASFEASKVCLHDLLSKPALAGIPLLVLGNKCDLPDACDEQTLSDYLELPKIARGVGASSGVVHMPLLRNGKAAEAGPDVTRRAGTGVVDGGAGGGGREVFCYHISAKNFVNVDVVMNWLVKHAGPRSPPPPGSTR